MTSSDQTGAALARVLAKYEEERRKRLRPEGIAQFADVARTDKFKHFAKDPWATKDNPYVSQKPPVSNGDHARVVITGAGYGALLIAARLIEEAGFNSNDFVFVDSAWGFGGTWYWNRYPGLMCDFESSCYMPLLEEMSYVPKHRYSYGPELRAYAELVAAKWGFNNRALFGSTIKDTTWDDQKSEWVTSIARETPKGPQESFKLRSDFFILASGLLNPGHVFHTSRWDYEYTGGTPENWNLDKLKGKKVAFIGTGATGIQVIPQLAHWADQLYVFQRTPSAVDVRGQRPIKPEEFLKEVTVGKGWQKERRENMAAFLSNGPKLPAKKLVDDGWTNFPSFSGMVDSPRAEDVTMENVEEYITGLHVLDFPRQERIRARVSEIVKDTVTAEALKPWYPGWCKRPCFHDDYLDAFNYPNVKLVDTDGKGVNGSSETAVLIDGQEIEVDVVILGTGFESFTVGSPAYRAGISITGHNGLSLDEKWTKVGASTLHGIFSRGFPNLLLTGVSQTGATVNVIHAIDVLAQHAGQIIAALQSKLTGSDKTSNSKIIIEPTAQAEEAWALQILARAFAFAGMPGCTPSYGNAEGAQPKSQEEQIIATRLAPWGMGINDYTKVVSEWEAKGDLNELDAQIIKA
ncbi:flavin-binding monooxygenase-like family protein [Hypoxylon trugodes]|uniref:flavin-binding monooxygenase-like family protein n=1 Tax=Hypoxylon trugodes TaxID=326681 RepID=UPI00219C1C00|nr:flavin-binding monooxygenase-like family protein [Hypoxylon trugodes]KAI1390869.1 flavin-binding monooxygenase-like family protein [Hypoxylon trugodes]